MPTQYTRQSDRALETELRRSSGNFGWLLKNNNEAVKTTYRGFYSREAAPVNGVTLAPQLQITFTPAPEPASSAMILVALSSLGLSRHRK